MLLGQMPGAALSHPSVRLAALPSYATLIAAYLDRFGPYRLQPYAPPTAPRIQQPSIPGVPPISELSTVTAPPPYQGPGYREAHDAPEPRSVTLSDPVGAGPGVLTNYDRLIDLFDGIANPFGAGIGFSSPTGMGLAALGLGAATGAARRGVVDKINAARRQGLINDANMRVQPGAVHGRAGGVGTKGVGGGFTQTPGAAPTGGAIKGQRGAATQARSNRPRSGGGGRGAKGQGSNRGPGSRGGGFDHFGGPR